MCQIIYRGGFLRIGIVLVETGIKLAYASSFKRHEAINPFFTSEDHA